MSFNPQRAEALRSAIHSTLDWLSIHSGDTATLLTEHLALLQEAELIYLTDAFVGDGEERIGAESERVLPDLNEFAARNEKVERDNGLRGDPHAELRKTWAPGQRWQCRTPGGDEWVELSAPPKWHSRLQYRRHPDDIDQPAGPKWLDWAGGKMPVKTGTRIRVKHRSGGTYTTTAGGDYAIRWTHADIESDIVAYRVVK